MMPIVHRHPSSIVSVAFAIVGLLSVSCVLQCSTVVVSSFTLPNHQSNIKRSRQWAHHYTQTKTSIASSPKDNNDGAEEDTATSAAPKEICILGGGFGGLNTALTLASLPWDSAHKPKITLVDRKERFVFLPLLYELCVGSADLEEVAPTFRSLLRGTDVEFVQRAVEGVDSVNNKVYLSSPSGEGEEYGSVEYDALVIATGADVNLSAVPGASGYALPFYTVEDCFELRRTLALFDSHASSILDDENGKEEEQTTTTVNVVVVGGGYSGVELALNVAERLSKSYDSSNNNQNVQVDVTLVHRGEGILQYATDYNREKGIDRLNKAGVTCRTACGVVDVSPLGKNEEEQYIKFKSSSFLENRRCRVSLRQRKQNDNDDIDEKEDDILDADLLLWTAGASSINVPVGVLNSILPRDSKGRIVTDAFLRTGTTTGSSSSSSPSPSSSLSAEEKEDRARNVVFALGDRARVTGRNPYGATAQVAIQQAAVVAWNVYASLTSSPSLTSSNPTPLVPFSYLDLGEMLTLGEEDATINSLNGLIQLDGASASILRRLIYAIRMPTGRQAVTAAISGLEKRVESRRLNTAATTLGKKNGVRMEKKKFSWK